MHAHGTGDAPVQRACVQRGADHTYADHRSSDRVPARRRTDGPTGLVQRLASPVSGGLRLADLPRRRRVRPPSARCRVPSRVVAATARRQRRFRLRQPRRHRRSDPTAPDRTAGGGRPDRGRCAGRDPALRRRARGQPRVRPRHPAAHGPAGRGHRHKAQGRREFGIQPDPCDSVCRTQGLFGQPAGSDRAFGADPVHEAGLL